MEELIITLNENDFFLYGFLCSIAFSTFFNIIISLINFFDNRKGLIKDYEEILYKRFKDEHFSYEDLVLYFMAVNNHYNRLEKRNKLDKLLSKFRRKKDE